MAKEPLDINILAGGEAGQGVLTVGYILSKALSRSGYHIFADQDYESRIRGGHYFFRFRVSDAPVKAVRENLDILLAMNKETVGLHMNQVGAEGVVVAEEADLAGFQGETLVVPIPLLRLAGEAGGPIMVNTVLVGVVTAILGLSVEILDAVLRDRFSEKAVADSNIKAAASGYRFVKENYPSAVRYALKARRNESLKLVMNGNEAIGLGAIAAGCTFMAAYPMTPSTPILEYFASKANDLGLVFIQAEDEISAVNMAIGASFAGARSVTATSGSGFCLMVEGLGLAGITETPLVIIDGQRPGPCVGLPTRTEQGDLSFVLTAHHGEFPRVVLAPASVEDAFWLAVKAFNLADRFQTPVIILNDQHLGESYTTVEPFDVGEVFIDRGELLSQQESDRAAKTYLRHRVTPSGISPRALPGMGETLVITDSDEHDEEGHLTESASDRAAQVLKRLRKEEGLACDISRPRWYGSGNPAVSFLSWGSSLGAVQEAVDTLKKQGVAANLLHFNQLWPFPRAEAADFLKEARRSIVVESNATGQLYKLIRQETGKTPDAYIRRFDGRPLSPGFILNELEKAQQL